jgi:hypothetical protein
MFNTREITFLGGGGLLAILCLLLPIGFTGKIVLGGVVLVASLVLVFAKTKAGQSWDEAIWKKLKKDMAIKHYSRLGGAGTPEARSSGNQTPGPENQPSGQQSSGNPAPALTIIALPDSDSGESEGAVIAHPIRFSRVTSDEVRPSSVVTYILVVVAVYVIYWLWNGGMVNISTLFSTISGR